MTMMTDRQQSDKFYRRIGNIVDYERSFQVRDKV